ncbi:3-hexulose-6-phosphate synthase [Bacillus sp. OV322]|uniref:3-hexulose-6-phosphate synthase n=1 Tax=Bacillus sp. OV322 TaxID=1882764 RepID=UPI0008E02DAE|nr:3-hexulose-6-phosphate synthase [Bacillus sp. OV322]SFC66243.1 3-hexulose-6-phosphate synthase [Bacillus sp. OV322]
MKLQLALDRLTIQEAIRITRLAEDYVDWIEVGTSLIKEFGMNSVTQLKEAFPHKIIVADCKTIDNARYEFEMCFEAGADVATVMGVSPLVTIAACFDVAGKMNKRVMIDLLNTSAEQIADLLKYQDGIFCHHTSRDELEEGGSPNQRLQPAESSAVTIAAAGGINPLSLPALMRNLNPAVAIVGSAITKADDPAAAARQFKRIIESMEGDGNE